MGQPAGLTPEGRALAPVRWPAVGCVGAASSPLASSRAGAAMLVARKTGLAGARPVPERLERLVEAEQPGGADTAPRQPVVGSLQGAGADCRVGGIPRSVAAGPRCANRTRSLTISFSAAHGAALE